MPTPTIVDLTAQGSSAEVNGAILAQSSSPQAAGTGVFNTFLGVDNSPTERGYNTTATPLPQDDQGGTHTTALQLGQVPIVNVGGVNYREFVLDLNQNVGNFVSLDAAEIYVAPNSNGSALVANSSLDGPNTAGVTAPFGTNATLVYNMDGGPAGDVSVETDYRYDAGSGKHDYVLLVPNANFAGFGDNSFVYFYSAFGYLGGDFVTNDGFEEWGVLTTTSGGGGSTPPAVVGIDKQISTDGSHPEILNGSNWLDVGAYVANTSSAFAPTFNLGDTVYYRVLVTNNTMPNQSDSNPEMAVTSLTDSNGPALTPALSGFYNVGDTDHDGLLGIGETWVYIGSTTAAAGLQVDTATVVGSVTDANGTTSSSNSDNANYTGALQADLAVTKDDGKTSVVPGTAETYTITVTNNGPSTVSSVNLTDTIPAILLGATFGTPSTGSYNSTTGVWSGLNLTSGSSVAITLNGTVDPAATGSITNIVTVSPPAGVNDTNPSNNTASDTDTITPFGPSLPGLTAGFWAQHLQVWNTWTGDDSTWSNISSKGSGVIAQAMDINPFPVVDWNQSGGITGATVFSSSGAVTVGNENDSGLLLGDLNHDGNLNDPRDLFFDLYSAQNLINSSTSATDTRQILAKQALASQLNDYNDFIYDQTHGGNATVVAEPNGLIEAAVQWLKGTAGGGLIPTGGQPGDSTGSNVNANPANDVGGVATVISDSKGSDYTTTGGITLGGIALSSSSPAWNTQVQVFSQNGWIDTFDPFHPTTSNIAVKSDGEGLKNALQVYNMDQLVVAANGSLIGWNTGSAIVDVHPNTANAFWGILHDVNLAHPGTIAGVT